MQNKTVVIVNGKPRSGKDTFCNFVIKHCEENGIYCDSWSTIDFEKEILEEVVNRNYDPTSSIDREFLSELKRLFNLYYDVTFRDFTNLIEYYSGVFLIHTREWSEILKFEDYCRDNNIYFIKVFVTRPKEQHFNNKSDALCDEEKNLYDVIIQNDGTLEDLKKNAEQFCESRLF